MKFVIFIFILAAVCWTTYSKKLPAHYPRCHKVKDASEIPAFEKCFVEVGLQWKKFLKHGIPEFRISSLDPFVIPEISVVQNGSVSFVLEMYNTSFIGLTDYDIDYFKYTMAPNMSINGTVSYKMLQMDGTYDLKGDFFGVKFYGDGPWSSNLTDVTVSAYADEELYTKKGKEYLNITRLDTITTIQKANMKLENFFGQNEVLNSALNDFLNEYSGEIIEAITPDIKQVISQVVRAVKLQLTSKIPYDDFFLPN